MNEDSEEGTVNEEATMNQEVTGNEGARGSFNDEDRERHKKQQRLCNSLGSLLSGIDRSKVNANTAPSKSNGNLSAAGSNVTNDRGQQMASTLGSRPSSSGPKKVEVDSWDALKFSERQDNDEVNAGWLESEKKLGSRPSGSGAKKVEVDSWDALKYSERRVEDEVDADWLESEHKKLDNLFGEGIITVMYTDQNTIGYNCRLCFATMNAMKCLEMHCNGMKHLKKKGIYEKSKAAGALLLEPRKNPEFPQYPENEPGPYPGQERNPFPREERDSFARDFRDPYARDYPFRDSYARDFRNDRNPYGRNDEDPYGRNDRDPFARVPYPRDSFEMADRRGPRSRSPSYADRYRESDRLSADCSYGAMDSRNFQLDAPLRIPSPPPGRLSPPPKRPALELPREKAGGSLGGGPAAINVDASLAGGPAAALLMKLSQCAIKNEKDAELASNIINLLLKSLKDYHQMLGEKSVADLMEQAEIKLGTAKAIRTIKKTTPTPQVDAVAIALETLRRANSDVPAFASLI
ncbi:uncharacterized protein [Macrobrachium rosenbergii]|uniref:uncharacterized protein isoform X2 n=1 Tax=Macrobrachium rosenbergii TaxID=79674 RepID=UPI0034D78AEB